MTGLVHGMNGNDLTSPERGNGRITGADRPLLPAHAADDEGSQSQNSQFPKWREDSARAAPARATISQGFRHRLVSVGSVENKESTDPTDERAQARGGLEAPRTGQGRPRSAQEARRGADAPGRARRGPGAPRRRRGGAGAPGRARRGPGRAQEARRRPQEAAKAGPHDGPQESAQSAPERRRSAVTAGQPPG